MGTDLRIYKETINYDYTKDKLNKTFEQVGETIHDIDTIDNILAKKEWGIEGECGAVAEVHGQDLIDVLMEDENEYSTDFIEEDEVYRIELSY